MIGILILARMGSSRLASKHFIEASGKPLMYWLIARFVKQFEQEIGKSEIEIVINTSDREENKKFLSLSEELPVKVFFGIDENIPLRHLQCSERYGYGHILSVDGDDILCSTEGSRKIVNLMSKSIKGDVFSSVGLPLGMNVSGININYLKGVLSKRLTKKLETGWGRIFKDAEIKQLELGKYDIMGDLRFTLDYEEDAHFFCAIINELKEKVITISDDDLIKLVIEKEYYKINCHVKEKYWANYNSEKQKELSNDQ
jgi:spore coat polysaccharide biosynthesis protein SpsF (cytidylyltransferase family)